MSKKDDEQLKKKLKERLKKSSKKEDKVSPKKEKTKKEKSTESKVSGKKEKTKSKKEKGLFINEYNVEKLSKILLFPELLAPYNIALFKRYKFG